MGRIETLAEPMSPSISERGVTERRNSPRRKPLRLAYVQFGRENGGMVKDVSEGGMRFHLMNPVAVGQELHFAVAIDAGRRIEGQARMVWTDATGKSGGFSFTELSAPSRDNLRAWLAEMDSPQSIVEPDAALTSCKSRRTISGNFSSSIHPGGGRSFSGRAGGLGASWIACGSGSWLEICIAASPARAVAARRP